MDSEVASSHVVLTSSAFTSDFLRETNDVLATLAAAQRRVNDRNQQMAKLLAEQEEEHAVIRATYTRLEELCASAALRFERAERAWAASVAEAIQKTEASWASRLAAAERQLDDDRRRYEVELDRANTSHRDALARIRSLETTLNEQQSAAAAVMASYAQSGRGAALLGLHDFQQRRVASVVHHREAHHHHQQHQQQHQHRRRAGDGTDGDTSMTRDADTAPSSRSQSGATSAAAEDLDPRRGLNTSSARAAALRAEQESYETKMELHREREARMRLEARLVEAERSAAEQRKQQHQQRAAGSDSAPPSPGAATVSQLDESACPAPVEGTPPRPAAVGPTRRRVLEPPSLMSSPAADGGAGADSGISGRAHARPTATAVTAAGGSGGNMALLQHSAGPSSIAGDESTPVSPEREASPTRPPPQPEGPPAALRPRSTSVGNTSGTHDRSSAASSSHDAANRITLGLVVGSRRQQGSRRGGSESDRDGLVGMDVLEVKRGSPAERAGIRPDSLLVELGGRRIASSADVQAALLDFKDHATAAGASGQLTASLSFQVIDLGSPAGDSWAGHMHVDVAHLAVGPFNQHREHYVSTLRHFAPVVEVDPAAAQGNGGAAANERRGPPPPSRHQLYD